MNEEALERFAVVVGQADVALGEACLAIAAHLGHPDPIDLGLDRLDALAGEVAGGDLAAVAAHLLGPGGFRGNRTDYYAADNSLLPEVLRRRVGIPITLAVVVIDVARRVDVPAVGVGLPGHFLVGDGPRPQRWIDAFAGPAWVGEEGARDLLRSSVGPRAPFDPSMLQATPDRLVVARVLNNLGGIHRAAGDASKLVRVHELFEAIGGPGRVPSQRAEHAEALAALGRVSEAAALLVALADDVEGVDLDGAEVLRARAQVLRASLN